MNILPVIVSALVASAIGAAWYSPLLFGRSWMRLAGIVPDSSRRPSLAPLVAGSVVLWLIAAYVLGHVLAAMAALVAAQGAEGGFWMWLGFVVPFGMMKVLYERRPLRLFLIDAGYFLVALLAMGAILAAW